MIVSLWESGIADIVDKEYTHAQPYSYSMSMPEYNTTAIPSISEGLAIHLKSMLNKHSSSSIFNGTSALNHLYTIQPYNYSIHMYTSNHTTNTSGGDDQWLGEKNGFGHATIGSVVWLYVMYVLLIMCSMIGIMLIFL